MVFSGTSLITGINHIAQGGPKATAHLMASASGHLDRMMRSNPNIADGSIGKVFSIARETLAKLSQVSADPIGTIINSNWHSVGAKPAP